MALYDVSELRLVQTRSAGSAANALWTEIADAVPAGKIWNIIGIGYLPSVAETQVVSFEKVTRESQPIGILNPVSLNLNPAIATGLTEGMEIALLPGEKIRVRRVAATAGSTMAFYIQFVEADMPLYEYTEPQLAKREKMFASTIRQRLGGGSFGGGGGGGRPAGERPGGPKPK